MPIREAQNTTKQHAVPQNIMDVEFKLVGDLTMRQFAYLFVFGIAAYLAAQNLGGVFKWPVTIIFSILGLSLAFVPVQERGLDEWVVNFLKAVYKPTKLIWRKEATLPTVFANQSLAVVQQEMITLAPTSSRRKLEDYINSYQSGSVEDPLDIPERDYVMKVRSAFTTVQAPATTMPDQTTTVSDMPETKEQPQIPVSAVLPPTEPTSNPPTPQMPTQPTSKPEPTPAEAVPVAKPTVVKQPPISLKVPSVRPKESFTSQPITPDRHSGRVFTRLLPKQGEIVLPIRGQKTLKTTEQLEIDEDITEKASQLKELLEQIRVSEGVEVDTKSQDIKKAADAAAQELKAQNVRITEEIEHIKRQEEKTPEIQGKLTQLEEKRSVTVEDYEALQKQLLELQEKVQDKTAAIIGPNTPVARKAPVSNMKPITSEPNIISGIVRDDSNNVLQGVVMIVKNNKGEPVRALKSDATGQFILSTPLSEGIYTVEVGPSNTLPFSFDIISVEVNGSVLPPVELIGKR